MPRIVAVDKGRCKVRMGRAVRAVRQDGAWSAGPMPIRNAAELRKNRDLVSDGDAIEQEFHVGIVERYASPRPVGLRPAAVDEYVAAERRVLRRLTMREADSLDRIVLALRYQLRSKTESCVVEIWIAHAGKGRTGFSGSCA